MNLFATASLARRIERAEVSMIEDAAVAARQRVGPDCVFLQRVAGGVAAFLDDGSPFNKVAGLGFQGVPGEFEMEAVEHEFASRKAALQVELSSLADPDTGKLLTRRGYELVGFENVLGLSLTAADRAPIAADASNTGIAIASAGVDDSATWLDAVTTGFLHPDTFDGPSSHENFGREALERAYIDTIATRSFERFLAWRSGQVAGGASFRIHEGIAQLCGAATLPDHRRRGVQSALLDHRLALAASRGCDLAVVTTQPGSKSQQNVQRFGFTLLYARAILVKPAPAAS